jgi:hypothetical protein
MVYNKMHLEIRFKRINIFKEILRKCLNKIDTKNCAAYNQSHLNQVEELPVQFYYFQ